MFQLTDSALLRTTIDLMQVNRFVEESLGSDHIKQGLL